MPTKTKSAARWLLLAAWLSSFLNAQTPNTAPDSAAALERVERATKIGGNEWAAEAKFFCLTPRANSPNDPLIEPTKIFDNVYAIGRSGTVVYAITTADGIILTSAAPS
jgi:hypothetical protein